MYRFKQHKRNILFLLLAFAVKLHAQTYGLINQEIGHLDGYILFAPLESRSTYLIDKCGKLVHRWQSNYKPAQSVYLLPNGNLLRTANDSNTFFISGGGAIEKFDWNNRLLWSYKISDSLHCLHHDIYPMPNGNVLAILWEKKTKAEAIAMGRNPQLVGNYVWNEKIVELKPKGKNAADIVWYWSVWDHLIQDFNSSLPNFGKIYEHPERININYNASTNEDWLHFNAIVYNEERNEILVSNRNFNEIFIIKYTLPNHAKSELQNDILFRWGNAQAYNPASKTKQQLYAQHSAMWIPKGLFNQNKILVFNNGTGRKGRLFSSVEIVSPTIKGNYQLDEQLKPDWLYVDTASKMFYSKNVSNAQMLPKGHVLICEGASGRFFELDERQTVVWEYINPVSAKGLLKSGEFNETNRVFRCTYYSKDYKAFKHKKLNKNNQSLTEISNVTCIPGSKP